MGFWLPCGSSHLLAAMIHVCQRVWTLPLGEQVRTGPEPGHSFSLRLWRTRGRNGKREGPIHPSWMPNGLSGWKEICSTQDGGPRIERPLLGRSIMLWSSPRSGYRVLSPSAFLWGQANKGNLRTSLSNHCPGQEPPPGPFGGAVFFHSGKFLQLR